VRDVSTNRYFVAVDPPSFRTPIRFFSANPVRKILSIFPYRKWNEGVVFASRLPFGAAKRLAMTTDSFSVETGSPRDANFRLYSVAVRRPVCLPYSRVGEAPTGNSCRADGDVTAAIT